MDNLGWEELVVFFVVLGSSTSIGIYYGFFGKKQETTQDYLLAGRKMSSIPVAMSLICSTVSAITLLGYPVEIYLYGTQYVLVVLCYIPLCLSLAYLYIPVYFNLNVSSAYEYVEMRFNSKLRTLVSFFAVLHVITSMSIAVYAPSLAIELVAGIDTRISTAVISFVCIFYSTLGGLKAVLWADVLQASIMLISLAVISFKGVSDVGGFGEMWEILEAKGRVEFLNFDVDPRTRHTVWTCLIAGYFFWLPTYASTQLQIQRFLSLPNIRRARRTIVINFVGLFTVVMFCFFTGMVIVAKYRDCDPIDAEIIENSDQLVPHFVESTVDGIPGLLGLFISGLTCASMSSLSSGLSALSSITTYDYIKRWFPELSDAKLSTISKINTFALGLITYGFIFVVEQMGSILPATTALSGLLIGPTLGLFTMGMFFPPTTTKGGFLGMLATIIIMAPYTIFQNIRSSDLPDQSLPLTTEGCSGDELSFKYDMDMDAKATWNWKDDDNSSTEIKILSMSYMWYSALTCCMTVFFAVIFSLTHRAVYPNDQEVKEKINSKCISPPLLRLWKKLTPEFIDKYVIDVDDENETHKKEIIEEEEK